MTAGHSFVRPFLRPLRLSGFASCLAAALLTASAEAQSRPRTAVYQPPTKATQSRARLAAWQNEAAQPPAFQPFPGTDPNAPALRPPQPESQPLQPPMPEMRGPMPEPMAEPMPEQRPESRPQTQPRSRSVLPPNQRQPQTGHHPAPPAHHEYVEGSLDGWIQGDGYNACGPHGCGGGCGPSCGPRCCGVGGCYNCPSPEDPCFHCRPALWWFKADLLLGFRKGRSYPPLVTTDPATEDSTTAGVLPNATVLFGGDADSGDSETNAGLNLEFGTFLNDCQNIGIGGRYFFFGDDQGDFARSSGQNAVLAIPFFSVDLGAPSSLLLAHPDIDGEVRSGSVAVRASNQVHGFDAYLRLLYCQTACGRIDFITGWHTSSVNDDFQLLMQTDGNQLDNDIRLFDEFNTENQFNGLILGIMTEHQVCCMTLRGKARVSVGNMHQSVSINGGTTINGVLDQNEPGGLFTSASNIGNYSQNQFAAVTEAGLSVGYALTPCTQFTVGYNLMYWSNVVRPGDQIDTVVDDLNVPPTRPTFDFQTSSFWVQSVTLGLNCEF